MPVTDKPQALAPIVDNIPAELRELRQWVCWRYDWNEDRQEWAKVPYSPAGYRASTTKEIHWRGFDEAVTAYHSGHYDGVGFVFAPNRSIVGIDLDKVRDPESGAIADWAKKTADSFKSYAELSVSGTGVHILIRGSFPSDATKRSGQIECYQESRFFTVTGHPITDVPTVEYRQSELEQFRAKVFPIARPVAPANGTVRLTRADDDVLTVIRQSTSGPSFDKLYCGDTSEYADEHGNIDDSKVDYALIGFLKMATHDAAQIERIARTSEIARARWDERRNGKSWLAYSIGRSLASGDDHSLAFAVTTNGHIQEAVTAPEAPEMETDSDEEEDTEPPAKPRYTLHHVSEAFQPEPPIPWVIDGMLTRGSVSLFVGAGGSKKTYALLDMVAAVALGDPWLSFETQQGRVLIIDEESGNRRLKMRLMQVLRQRDADPLTPIWYTTIEGFNLRLASDIAAVRGMIAETQPTLVLIDALVDVMPGADENAAQEVHPIFHALRTMAEQFQCAIVVIHHSNKAGGYRGSTSMAGAVDLLMMVKSPPKETTVTFESEKVRDTEELHFTAIAEWDSMKQTFALVSTTDNKKPTVRFSRPEREVLRRLADAPGHRAMLASLASKAETCSDKSIRGAVRSLADRGYCRRSDDGGPGTSAEYTLTSQTTDDEAARIGTIQ